MSCGKKAAGVWIGPGLSVFTRMRLGASSAASVRPNDRKAAFVAAQTLIADAFSNVVQKVAQVAGPVTQDLKLRSASPPSELLTHRCRYGPYGPVHECPAAKLDCQVQTCSNSFDGAR